MPRKISLSFNCALFSLLFGSVLFAVAPSPRQPHFEPNLGQTSARFSYLVKSSWGTAGISTRSIELFRRGAHGQQSARLQFAGTAGTAATMQGSSPLAGVSHYAMGQDPSRWLWDVPRFAAVEVASLYPGIGLRYYTTSTGAVEFDFHVAPRASTRQIRMDFADPLQLDDKGGLISGSMHLRAPKAWQTLASGQRRHVDVRYVALGANTAGLLLGAYDRSLPLTIDPVIEFATFLGGSQNEANTKITADADGVMFVTGSTTSPDFPATLPDDSPLNRPQLLLTSDIYVSRLRSGSATLDWSLFFGGTNADIPVGIRLDDFDNLYVMGLTSSANFPVTPGAFRTVVHPSLTDAFVIKLDAKTGRLKASTYLNTSIRQDVINTNFAVDPAGGSYIAGLLNDPSGFTTTQGVLYPNANSSQFAMRLNASLSAVVYATYLNFGSVSALEADSAGNLILAGRSASATFPAVNAIPEVNQKPAWSSQAYVAKLNPSASAVVFATLLHGGESYSMISDMKLSNGGVINLLGFNYGSEFPVVDPIPYDRPEDTPPPTVPVPFFARLGPQGGSLLQSTLFYGPEFTSAPLLAFPPNLRLAILPDGRTCMINANTGSLKQTPGALGSTTFGGTLLCLDPEGMRSPTKTFLPAGASYREISLLPNNSVLLAGTADQSFGSSITDNALQPHFGGDSSQSAGYPILSECCFEDAFLLHLSLSTRQPKVTGMNPGALLLSSNTSGARSFEVYGSDFSFGLTAFWNGEPISSEFIHSRLLRLPAVNYNALRAGENRLQVSQPGNNGGAGAEATLKVFNPTPDVLSFTPSSLSVGAGETKLLVFGDNLLPDSILLWNGVPRTARFIPLAPGVLGGYLEVTLASEELATPTTIRIVVTNRPPGGGASKEALLAVLPPSVNPLTFVSITILFSESAPAAAEQTVFCGGCTAATKVFWDGQEIPAELASVGRIRIRPPAADLLVWGVHTIEARDGTQSSGVRDAIVARLVQLTGLTAYDPASRLLWCLSYAPTSLSGYPDFDLLSIDARTGAIVSRIEKVTQAPVAMTISTDGRYVYLIVPKLGEPGQPNVFRRLNTQTKTIDLEWTDSEVLSAESGYVMVSVPGSPETIAVFTGARGVYIFDRNRRRPVGGVDINLRADDTPVFATRQRVYVNPSDGACWRWIEFDERGARSVTRECSAQLPPDVVRDGSVLYFRDGQRFVPISIPNVRLDSSVPVRMAVDPARRRAYSVSTTFGSSLTIYQFDMDSGQQKILLPALSNSLRTEYAIYADGDGIVYASGNLLVRAPSK